MEIISNFNSSELYFLIYIIVINFISFMAYGIDKSKAKNKQWRIPEFTLIFLSLIGGALGGLMAMVIYKHKLSKKSFYIGLPFIIILNKIMEIAIFNYLKWKNPARA